MSSLAASIQKLLQLSAPLPPSITDELRVGTSVLLRADEDFKAIAHDLRVWTLYETIDSRLSGGDTAAAERPTDKKDSSSVYFTAPLASIKSAILGMRQERIFPLQSDHANVASFGRHNSHTLRLFLRQLGGLISRADASVRATEEDGEDGGGAGVRWTLNLEQRVSIEVHGFFEDSTGTGEAGLEEHTTRAWSTRLPLREFLRKGPDECLNERLNEVHGVPDENQFLRKRGRTMTMTEPENDMVRREASAREGLGIRNQLLPKGTTSPPISPVIRPLDASPKSAPEIVPSPEAMQRVRRISSPPLPTNAGNRLPTPSRYSTPMRRPSPLIWAADFDQDPAVDRLSPPTRPRSILSLARSASDQTSQFEYRDFPPFSQQRSRSSVADGGGGGGALDDFDSIETSPALPLPEAVVAIRKVAEEANRKTSETVVVDDAPVAFSRPDANKRKFVWVHLPYNNPTWVKVRTAAADRRTGICQWRRG